MPKPKRIAQRGVRHRRDNGPKVMEVVPVAPPTPKQLGSLHHHTHDIIGSGPKALLQAHHRASKLSEHFGEELKDQWRLKTSWLTQLETGSPETLDPSHTRGPQFAHIANLKGPSANAPDGRAFNGRSQLQQIGVNRARARYAMRWRPTFLAVVALSHSVAIGAKAAKVAMNTVTEHRHLDPEFDAQVIAAQDHCIELLHAVTMRRALEGDLEPVYWQGIEVGHIKKFDGRLQIEMLRAHLPTKFKTPGTKVAIQTGDNSQNLFICGPEERAELIAARRETLERIAKAREIQPALPAS